MQITGAFTKLPLLQVTSYMKRFGGGATKVETTAVKRLSEQSLKKLQEKSESPFATSGLISISLPTANLSL